MASSSFRSDPIEEEHKTPITEELVESLNSSLDDEKPERKISNPANTN